MTSKLSFVFSMLSMFALAEVSASDDFPFPFSGTYRSLASEAQELISRKNNTWVSIPQNVYLTLIKDRDILELKLNVEVLDDAGRTLYPIENSMWLRHAGNNQLEVYKLNRATRAFEQKGDGACSAMSCSYEYVTLVNNNGSPYKQKYMSTITWMSDNPEASFTQSGSLSAEVLDVEDSQESWLLFKTWSNQFEESSAR